MYFTNECPHCQHKTLVYCFEEEFIICPDCGKKTKFSEINSGIIWQNRIIEIKEKAIIKKPKKKRIIKNENIKTDSIKLNVKIKPITKKNERVKPTRKLTNVEKQIRKVWLRLRSRSIEKKFVNLIEFEEFVSWYKSTENVCHYCNNQLEQLHQQGSIMSIDRKDSSKEYTIDNIVKSCMICNATKNQFYSESQFKKIAEYIVNIYR